MHSKRRAAVGGRRRRPLWGWGLKHGDNFGELNAAVSRTPEISQKDDFLKPKSRSFRIGPKHLQNDLLGSLFFILVSITKLAIWDLFSALLGDPLAKA